MPDGRSFILQKQAFERIQDDIRALNDGAKRVSELMRDHVLKSDNTERTYDKEFLLSAGLQCIFRSLLMFGFSGASSLMRKLQSLFQLFVIVNIGTKSATSRRMIPSAKPNIILPASMSFNTNALDKMPPIRLVRPLQPNLHRKLWMLFLRVLR
jgi:hypothetical protein